MLFFSSKLHGSVFCAVFAYFLMMVGSGTAQMRVVDGVEVRGAIVARLAAEGEQASETGAALM